MGTNTIPDGASRFKPLRPGRLGILLICLVFLATGFSSCATKRSPPPTEDQAEVFRPVSDALRVDLFFDATLSMRGFVSTETSSTYQQTVPLLERAVIEGWKGGQISFNKFGDDIAPLPGRTYLDATKPTFYGDSKYNKKTLIERVIDRAQADHLTVIVTDLFQTNADVNQLTEKLKEKFIVNDLAIGIFALRSEFAGLVHDVGPDSYSFEYKSKEKPNTHRPFYLLAFGSHADTAHYFKVLGTSGFSSFPEKHELIFSRHLSPHPSSFNQSKLKAVEKISQISGSNVLSEDYKGDRVKAFKINKGVATAKFSIELPYDAPFTNVLTHSHELTPEVTIWKSEDTGAKALAFVEIPQSQKSFRISAQLLPDQPPFNGVQINAEVAANELPVAGIYRFRVLLRPSKYSLPDWVATWNMRDNDIKAWHLHPKEFDGSKTYNLETFLGTLQGSVLSNKPPKVCDVYFYLRVAK